MGCGDEERVGRSYIIHRAASAVPWSAKRQDLISTLRAELA